MRTRFWAVTLVAACVSISEAQVQTKQLTLQPVPRDTARIERCLDWNWMNRCVLAEVNRLKNDASVCTEATVCKAKNDSLSILRARLDSLERAEQERTRSDSIARAKAIANRRTPRPGTAGGPPPSAVSRGTSPTQLVPVVKGEATIKVDTLWRTRYDTVTKVVERTIFQIDTLVIVRQDTLKIHQVEFRDAKGFPVGKVVGWGAAIAAAGCYVASVIMDNKPFRCFGGNEITNENNNHLENGVRSVRAGFSFTIGRP